MILTFGSLKKNKSFINYPSKGVYMSKLINWLRQRIETELWLELVALLILVVILIKVMGEN